MERTGSQVVVAAAIVRRGTVLAAQRGHPPELAGRWELPGGKVEPGESEPEALARECREELGSEIVVGARLGPDLPTVDGRHVLRVYAAELAERTPQPRAGAHRALRWVRADQLAGLDWLDADRPLIWALEGLLRGEPLPLAVGMTDLDEEHVEPEPDRSRRHLVRPLRPLVTAVTGLLVALGLVQSAVLASGAADAPTKVDPLANLQSVLYPPPFPGLSRTLTLLPAGLLPAATTCRTAGLLRRGAVVTEAEYRNQIDDAQGTEVVLLRYPSERAAAASVTGVVHQLRTTCRSLRPTALAGGSLPATYNGPVTIPGKGYEIFYSGSGSLRDSASGSPQDLSYRVRGDIALLQHGPYVVEVADGYTVYGTEAGVDTSPRRPVPLATVLLERLEHGH